MFRAQSSSGITLGGDAGFIEGLWGLGFRV